MKTSGISFRTVFLQFHIFYDTLLVFQFAKRWIAGSVPFSWVSNGRRSIFFSKWCLTSCQWGTHFDRHWYRAIKPSKNYFFPRRFSSISRFYAILCLSLRWGVTGSVPFSWDINGGRSIFFSKWCLTCCQGVTQFDLQCDPAINISKLMKTNENSAK